MPLPGLIAGGQALQQDANNRTTNQHLLQLIAARALAMQNEATDRARMEQGRANAGLVLPQIFAAPTGPAPQPPLPGQGSVPMMQPGAGAPPMGAPGGMSAIPDSMPPGAPVQPAGAAPEAPLPSEASAPPAAPPVGWTPSPGAPPELGGPEPTAPGGSPGEPASVGAPPAMPKIPSQLLSVPNLIQAMQERNIPPDQMVDTLKQLEPIINSENRFAIAQFKAENDAMKAATTAYKAAIDRFKAENQGRDITSKIERREASVAQGDRRLDIAERSLSSRLASASAKAAAGDGAAPEELTPGGLAVAAELARAGLPQPGGWGKTGVSRGNRILNQMALEQEGGAGSGTIAAGRGTFKADQSSYQQRQRQVDALEAASKKIEKDIDTMLSVMDKGVAGSVTLVNEPMNVLRRKFSDPALTKYALAVKLVGVEYERMINGGLLSIAQLHEGAREDAAKIINESMTPEQIKSVIPVMLQEIANQRNAHHEQLDLIKSRMKTTAGAKAGGGAPSAAPADGDDEAKAKAAIAKGADAAQVRALYKQRTGKDLP